MELIPLCPGPREINAAGLKTNTLLVTPIIARGSETVKT
jgi:hypothetical protein